MKKSTWFILAIVLITFIVGILIFILQSNATDIKAFDFGEYQQFTEDFSSVKNLGDVSDAKDLLKKVEAVWIEMYGEDVKKQKPYQVFYDEENGVWLVCGTLHSEKLGGTANILVEDATGKVLAVWHEK